MTTIRWIIAIVAAAALWAWARMRSGNGFTPILLGETSPSDRSEGLGRAGSVTQWRDTLSESLSDYRDTELRDELSSASNYVTPNEPCLDSQGTYALALNNGIEYVAYCTPQNLDSFPSWMLQGQYDPTNPYQRELVGGRDADRSVVSSGTQFDR